MDVFEEFLTDILREGKVVFKARPVPPRRPSASAIKVAADAFGVFRLDVAGPPIDFNPSVACEAAELVRQACWALVNRADAADELANLVRMRSRPKRPSDHLSADLFLRYLPRVRRRAGAGDPLVDLLDDVLRSWPLSRSLITFKDREPESPDLGGHPGLMLLYAERLAAHQRPDLVPAGVAGEFVQLVRQGGGRESPRSTEGGGWDDGSWNG